MLNENLGIFFRVKSGDGIAISKLKPFGMYPVYGGNGINGYTSNYNVEGDTLVIGRVGEKCGNVNITATKSWVSDNALIVIPKTKYNIEYLSYLLEFLNLNDYANRNAQPVISGQIIYAIEAPFEGNEELQEKIAQTLSQFDTYIDDLGELIEKKKGIRDGALEDLVSGRTRLDGYEYEWQEGKIGDILKILHGKNQREVESYSGKYPILGTGGIIGKATEFLCDWECVLIGRKGTIDNPMYMNTPFWTIDTLYYSKPTDNQCVKFQYYLFCTINWYDYTESSGRPSLAKKVIEAIPIRIPRYEEQVKIAKVLTAMDKEIADLETEREKIIQIREGAMDDLLTGRVRLTT